MPHAKVTFSAGASVCAVNAAYQYIIIDELVYVVCIAAIVHGVFEGSQVLAMHVQDDVPHPVYPPAS